jgi:hypothetical protein
LITSLIKISIIRRGIVIAVIIAIVPATTPHAVADIGGKKKAVAIEIANPIPIVITSPFNIYVIFLIRIKKKD